MDRQYVFISDVHLGSKFCDTILLGEFLASLNERPTTLCLTGDIFDFWKMQEIKFSFKDYLPSNTNLIYLPGNHDAEFNVLKTLTKCSDLPLTSGVQTSYMFELPDIDLLATHGHIFDEDYGDPYNIYFRLKDLFFYLISSVLGIELRETWIATKLFPLVFNKTKFFENAAKFAKRNNIDVIVLGHSHICGEIETSLPVKVISLGNWTSRLKSPTALFVRGNEYVLHEIKPGDIYPEENCFKDFRPDQDL